MSDMEIDSNNIKKDISKSSLNDDESRENENIVINQESIDTDSIDVEMEIQEDQQPKENVLENVIKSEEWEDILGSGSIMKLLVKEGKLGTRPISLQNCKIQYKCFLEDGTLVEEQDDLLIQIGDNDVIQGLDVGVALMDEGETCKLKIESRLAYGNLGLKPNIPPNSTLIYEVTLLSTGEDDEPENLSFTERKIKGNKKRERGNWWYVRGENQIAIQCYRRALDYLDEVEGGIKQPLPDGEQPVTDKDLQKLLEDRLNVCNNMAAAQIKLELYDAALQSLQTVLRCQPENVKALYRKAKILKAKNDINGALQILNKASRIDPTSVDIQKEISSLQALLKKEKDSEIEIAKRMFKKHSAGKKPDDGSPLKLYLWATLGASIAMSLAGAVAIYKFNFLKNLMGVWKALKIRENYLLNLKR